jgi:hypothetical protein
VLLTDKVDVVVAEALVLGGTQRLVVVLIPRQGTDAAFDHLSHSGSTGASERRADACSRSPSSRPITAGAFLDGASHR